MALSGLDGRVVIVTGGAAGIGRAVGERLLAEGSGVALVDLNEGAVHAASDELAGERMLGIAADVSTEEGTEKYAAAIEPWPRGRPLRQRRHRRAGQRRRRHGSRCIRSDHGRERQRCLSRRPPAVAAARRAAYAGAIVTTSSVLGIRGLAGSGSYCASKAAVIRLTRTAAMEARTGRASHQRGAPGPSRRR